MPLETVLSIKHDNHIHVVDRVDDDETAHLRCGDTVRKARQMVVVDRSEVDCPKGCQEGPPHSRIKPVDLERLTRLGFIK